jgi:hypothetical protein
MARSCEFAVVKIAPDPIRDEALNGAVVIFHPDRLVHRFLGTDHFRRIHVIHDGLYPGF